jgi:hypothetical protein
MIHSAKFGGIDRLRRRPRFVASGAAFVGALDAYASGLVALYSPFKRLLSNYNGYGVRVRRSSDSSLLWVGFNADGTFDATNYLAFIGAGNGFAHTIADQSGNGRDITRSTASAQAQIGVDANGNYYLFAPGSGSTTTSYEWVGSAGAAPQFMMWSVASSPGVWHVPLVLRDNGASKERALLNYGTSSVVHFQDNATGSNPANITLTSGLAYSTVFGANGSESRQTNRLSTTTGTRVANSCNIDSIGLGRVSGATAWLQNGRWYMAAAWSRYSAADMAALATLGKTLIPDAQ